MPDIYQTHRPTQPHDFDIDAIPITSLREIIRSSSPTPSPKHKQNYIETIIEINNYLKDNGTVSYTEIQKNLKLSSSSLDNALKIAVKKKWIAKRYNENKPYYNANEHHIILEALLFFNVYPNKKLKNQQKASIAFPFLQKLFTETLITILSERLYKNKTPMKLQQNFYLHFHLIKKFGFDVEMLFLLLNNLKLDVLTKPSLTIEKEVYDLYFKHFQHTITTN